MGNKKKRDKDVLIVAALITGVCVIIAAVIQGCNKRPTGEISQVSQQNGKGNPTYELSYELGYRVNMTKFAYIQPDMQWIVNPGGTGNIPNALVLGAQMGVVF